MSQALYRKYRSKTLTEIVGQEHVTEVLAKALAKKRIGHAFLFTGPRGVGKTSIARILAHEINELPYTDESHHLDIIEIDAASNRRIDDIRDLREKIHVAPTSAKYKVYIIDEVHMLTGESFNALLKTLEEPPTHAIFMLATTEVHKLPATIISRTQRFHLRPVTLDKVVGHLKYIAMTENIRITDDALQLVAEHGEGSFRDSISLLDQLGSLAGDESITAELVEATLGLAPATKVTALFSAIAAKDQAAIVTQLDNLEKQGVSAVTLTNQLITRLRQETTGNYYALIDKLLDVAKASNPPIKLLTTLALYADKTPSKPTPVKTMATAAATPQPVVSSPITKLEKKPVSPKQPEKHIPSNPSALPATIAWEAEVLEYVRKKYVPLYSVLKHGKVEYEGGVLTVYFAYELHRKKLDTSKYTAQFIDCLKEIYGESPKVITKVGTLPPKDETAAAVAAIMGGGEEVAIDAEQ